MQSRWYPSRLWIGYASNVGRFVMPLAKFFYGDTHKWYFRSAAAIIVASYVTAVAAYFEDKHRWILYFIALLAISAVYWLIYAPAKWVQKDNVKGSRSLSYTQSRLVHEIGGEYEFADELLHERVQAILYNGAVPEPPGVPVEARVLHLYLMDHGRSEEAGPYRHTRQWAPPGFWRGYKEFGTFTKAVRDEKTGSFSGVVRKDGWEREREGQLQDLAKAMQYLDKHSPTWRKKARMWDEGGRVRAVGRELQKQFFIALNRIRSTRFVSRT